ncbi:uncharacterized protein YndB with AHSA1/START domain [Motilibacter rhizosphaerae]|uniref:Uncharacterized protein YndB with AHSA1/START domain n=1 Tax=Motilibacter rhizosphaerae TaxID=598652 RepID=A0A4Q7NB80_9ACTN|nr:SRPBCC domain-containing protein [Motilibacter rhizosphaerae]RZS80159.1 uncharacterized protein YndB with AHSA1/START domain [Motilibacter rhizosphaerae]
MELGTLEREIFIAAEPDVVFAVVSDPEHVRRWWPDEAAYELVPGAPGHIAFGDGDGRKVAGFSVVEALAPRSFSFRWTQEVGEPAEVGNSMLVTFELVARDGGTLLRLTETGFRERGWSEAVVAETHADHSRGWDFFLSRLPGYVASLGVEV